MLIPPPLLAEFPDVVVPTLFGMVWRSWLAALYKQFSKPLDWKPIQSFQNSWVDAAVGGSAASYAIDPMGRVWLRGTVRRSGGPTVTGEAMFSLPWVASNTEVTSTFMNGPALVRISVNTAGAMIWDHAAGLNPTYVSLNGFSYASR